MGTRGIRVGTRGIRVGTWWIKVGMWGDQGGNAGSGGRNAGNGGGNAGNHGDFLWESLCLLLRLKSRSSRGAFHHSAFMGSCPTISHTFFALSTKWMSCPSRKWGRGVSPRFHLLIFVFLWIRRIRTQEEFKIPLRNPSGGNLLLRQSHM